MSSFFSAEGECLMISPDQWEQLDVALEAADIDRARELWRAWGLPMTAIETSEEAVGERYHRAQAMKPA